MDKAAAPFSFVAAILAGFLFLALPVAASAASQKKSKNSDADSQAAGALLPLPLSDEIDHDIGEMLGAFQVGDVNAMHKYYADNATFVSGVYEPPVMGWANYVNVYQRERAAFPNMQILRRNTFIFHNGDVAWASYQWEFVSQLNGRPYSAEGQTTLVFNKVGNSWLIVHNHTSQICPANTPVQPQLSQTPSAPPYVPDRH